MLDDCQQGHWYKATPLVRACNIHVDRRLGCAYGRSTTFNIARAGRSMGLVNGKVAFVTGAARGQGRSHAVRLAEEGADIIAVDLCQDIPTIGYPMAKPEDLEETAKLVEKTGRGAVTAQADVREASQLRAALERGIAQF